MKSGRPVPRGAVFYAAEDGASMTADEILLPEDDGPIDTGLFDAAGRPIYRTRRKLPFGFVGSA